jgi:hypothetical protein
VAITPTVLIAAQGLLSGGGIAPNSIQTTSISNMLNNSLLSAYLSVANNSNIGNVSGLSATLATLPTTFTNANIVAYQVPAQASHLAPNVATFITLYSTATTFCATSMDYGAALNQFSNIQFGDLGIGVSNFTDVNSGGLTSLLPQFSLLTNQITNNVFDKISNVLGTTLLAEGTAAYTSAILKDSLEGISIGLTNYGNLQNFGNPQTLGYQSLLQSLQGAGLAQSLNINSALITAGYDPTKPYAIPDSVLYNIYSSITADSLQKIITQLSANPVNEPNTLNDLLDPSFMMPKTALIALGLKPGCGISGLKVIGNALTNIGIHNSSNSALITLINSIQTKTGGYLNEQTVLVPSSVSASLRGTYLGTGNSLFGTPLMIDMFGSLAGVHIPQFNNITIQLVTLSSNTIGQSLITALQNMNTALTTNSGTAGAYSILQTAISNFNAQLNTNNQYSAALASANSSVSMISTQLAKEINNFSLAGITLGSAPSAISNNSQIMNFASLLHDFGVDKQQLGHNDVLSGAVTNDLNGDAISSALLEGKNINIITYSGRNNSGVSDTRTAQTTANDNNIVSFIQNFNNAKMSEQSARTALLSATASTAVALTTEFIYAHSVAVSAQNNLLAAANSAGRNALTQALSAIAEFHS